MVSTAPCWPSEKEADLQQPLGDGKHQKTKYEQLSLITYYVLSNLILTTSPWVGLATAILQIKKNLGLSSKPNYLRHGACERQIQDKL